MYSLLIEGATEKGVIAFCEGDKILYQVDLPFGLNNSKNLLLEINQGFNVLGLKPVDLSYIAIGIGPGSYTGIRIVAAVAKTFSYACKIPLVSICSLHAFIPNEDATFASVIDAKISGMYVQKGVKKQGKVIYSSEPRVLALNQANEYLKEVNLLVTPQSLFLQQKLDVLFPQAHWEWKNSSPSIIQMVDLACEKYQKKEFSSDSAVSLLYLRKTQAELERGKDLFSIVSA